jgi:cell division GTPase FtsZ
MLLDDYKKKYDELKNMETTYDNVLKLLENKKLTKDNDEFQKLNDKIVQLDVTSQNSLNKLSELTTKLNELVDYNKIINNVHNMTYTIKSHNSQLDERMRTCKKHKSRQSMIDGYHDGSGYSKAELYCLGIYVN